MSNCCGRCANKADADGWIAWDGGVCPVGLDERVQYRMRYGGTCDEPAGELRWSWAGAAGDIVAYRVAKSAAAPFNAEAAAAAPSVYDQQVAEGQRQAEEKRLRGAKPYMDPCSGKCSDGSQMDFVSGMVKLPDGRTVPYHEWAAVAVDALAKPEQRKHSHYFKDVGDLPTDAQSFLDAAAECLGERAAEYDQPTGERSIPPTIKAFNAITGRDLTDAEGALFMSLLKKVRLFSADGFHRDSAVDGVAYSALMAEAKALEAQG